MDMNIEPQQWRNGSAPKTGRREVTGSIPGRAYQPIRSEFSPGFLRNSHKYRLGSLRKTPQGGYSSYRPRSHKRTIGFNPTTQCNAGVQLKKI